jgi:hypothetical protein
MYNIAYNVLGPGTVGYAQPLKSSSVSSGVIPTAIQWNNLNQDLISAYIHQGSLGSLTLPSTVATKSIISASDFAAYLALANSILATPHAIGNNQASLVNLQSGSQGKFTGSVWNTLVTHTLVMVWPSNAALRGFWNAGGNFQFSASLTPGSSGDAGYAKELDWQMLLSNMRTITISYNAVTCNGSYTSINSTAGYFNLSSSSTNIFQKSTSSPTYTPNQYDIYVMLNGTPNTATTMTFSIQFQDNSQPSGFGVDEYISAATVLQSTVYAYYASGTYVQSALPTITNTISGS